MGADTSVVKKKHEWKPMADEERMENTKILKVKGEKAMDTNTGGIAQGTWTSPNNLELT